MAQRGQKELTLEKKIELIKASEAAVPKPRQDDLSKQFGIGRSTVSDILRKHAKYLEAWESNRLAKRRRIVKTTPTESLKELLFHFFSQRIFLSVGQFFRAKHLHSILSNPATSIIQQILVTPEATNHKVHTVHKPHSAHSAHFMSEAIYIMTYTVDPLLSEMVGTSPISYL